VHPDVPALLVTPICAHTLFSRPLVLPGDASVTLRLRPRGREGEEVMVTADGQVGHPLNGRDLLHVRRGANPVRVVKVGEADFYQRLKDKLHWGTRL